MNPLDSYLSQVARELRSMPPSKRDDELRELRSHLEQRAEDFAAQGFAAEAAQTQALDEFGSPRALGTELFNVWEEGLFSTKRLLLAIGRVTLFWFCATVQLLFGNYAFRIWDQGVLFPELSYIVPLTALCLPLTCGWLWSSCLGRRRHLMVLLFCVVAFDLLFLSACLGYVNGWRWDWTQPTTEPSYNLILALNPLLAVAGAYLEHAFRKGRGHLALASGQAIPTTFSRFNTWNTPRIRLCVGLIISAGFWGHVYITLHPPDPVSALRTSFLVYHNPLSTSAYWYPIESPSILELCELPAITPAETAGRERRVFFKIEAHANKVETQAQADGFKSDLPLNGKHTPEVENRIHQSIAVLQHNSHTFQGIARLVQTPEGWQVDERSFELWAWFYIANNPSESDPKIPQ